MAIQGDNDIWFRQDDFSAVVRPDGDGSVLVEPHRRIRPLDGGRPSGVPGPFRCGQCGERSNRYDGRDLPRLVQYRPPDRRMQAHPELGWRLLGEVRRRSAPPCPRDFRAGGVPPSKARCRPLAPQRRSAALNDPTTNSRVSIPRASAEARWCLAADLGPPSIRSRPCWPSLSTRSNDERRRNHPWAGRCGVHRCRRRVDNGSPSKTFRPRAHQPCGQPYGPDGLCRRVPRRQDV